MTDPFERAVAREELEHRERVTRWVGAGFGYHLRAYLLVNLALVAIWLWTTGPTSHPWPVWPAGGWGLGLYFHWTHYRFHQTRDRELRARLEADGVPNDRHGENR